MTIWREAHDDWNFRMSLSTKLSHEAVFDRHRARLEQWGVASAEMFKTIIQAWQARQRRNLAKQRGR